MGLISSLAFALIPLLRRDSSPTRRLPIVSRLSELEAENARLRSEIESLSKDRDDSVALADGWRWRAEQANQHHFQQMQASMQAHAQVNQQAQACQQLAMTAQNLYAGQLGQLGQAQAQQWYHCDCTPRHGRYGYLRGDN
jgi:hypothetical protein